MKYNNKISNINKEKIKRIHFLKIEIKKLILKSIIQNLNVKPYIRSLCLKKINKFKIKSSISRQKNNICLYSGRYKGCNRINNMGRHTFKRLCDKGYNQNFKIKSW